MLLNLMVTLDYFNTFELTAFYLKLNSSRTYEEQGVAVPDVNVHGVEGQIAKEPALLPRPQETVIYSELQLQTWRA